MSCTVEESNDEGVDRERGDASNALPECYVIVHNVTKRHNLGTLARSATAFNVTQMILVGRRDYNAFGSHGSADHVSFRHFHTLPEARDFLKERGCDICGVEIVEGALPVHRHPFRGSTAFLLGNEPMRDNHAAPPVTPPDPATSCQVYVRASTPPPPPNRISELEHVVDSSGVAAMGQLEQRRRAAGSLTGAVEHVALAVVMLRRLRARLTLLAHCLKWAAALRQLASRQGTQLAPSEPFRSPPVTLPMWAGYPERGREGHKFVVEDRPVRRAARNMAPEDPAVVAKRRAQRAELASRDWLGEEEDDAAMGGLALLEEEET
eukprot:jgi/Mesen1/6414/ME000329S05577